jgi:two-component system response regulator NreC
MIKVSLLDKHPVICDAICALLSNSDDIEIVSKSTNFNSFIKKIPEVLPNILIAITYSPDDLKIDEVKIMANQYQRIRMLVMSMYHDEKQILRLIKAGAKGHISKDTNRSEILEAIYTLRNGYDFYDQTITSILLNSYLSDEDIKPTEKENRQKNLSTREMEIFKLIAEGDSNRSIAEKLFISVRTVETHKNNIMKKIGLKTTVDLVKFAIKNNIIQLD